ncbi:DUF58 domain-containing protein [Dokdonella sp.]|uniref:DUF58 domain-containing protein n=1 Tax=Dokdonella sp. TaxID=2291710 RepID=UPI0025BB9C7B|nr:DUF58 domain-containing protein [Dokdonella sp.]MBX3688646.1 DUF58 domain-containing protein [Dokdonella sp.]
MIRDKHPGSGGGVHVALDELIALSAMAHGAALARERRTAALRSGTSVSRWRGRGVDFRESRIYQPGDEIRHMDWRVTARTNKPHTKLFEEEREQALLLALDCNPSMRFGTRARFKSVQAARAAALLAWMASRAGDRVGVIGFGGGVNGEVKPAGGRRGVLRVLRAIRDWDHAPDKGSNDDLSQALARMRHVLRPGMRLVLLTDGFSADAPAVLPLPQLAARHEIAVVLLRDALELHAPPPGRYAVHLGATRRIVDFADPRVRDAWVARFSQSRTRLLDECRRLGIRVVELDTDADLRQALMPLLARSRSSKVVA